MFKFIKEHWKIFVGIIFFFAAFIAGLVTGHGAEGGIGGIAGLIAGWFHKPPIAIDTKSADSAVKRLNDQTTKTGNAVAELGRLVQDGGATVAKTGDSLVDETERVLAEPDKPTK